MRYSLERIDKRMTDPHLPKPTSGSTQLPPAKPVSQLEPSDQKQLPQSGTVPPTEASLDNTKAPTPTTPMSKSGPVPAADNMKGFAGVTATPANPGAPQVVPSSSPLASPPGAQSVATEKPSTPAQPTVSKGTADKTPAPMGVPMPVTTPVKKTTPAVTTPQGPVTNQQPPITKGQPPAGSPPPSLPSAAPAKTAPPTSSVPNKGITPPSQPLPSPTVTQGITPPPGATSPSAPPIMPKAIPNQATPAAVSKPAVPGLPPIRPVPAANNKPVAGGMLPNNAVPQAAVNTAPAGAGAVGLATPTQPVPTAPPAPAGSSAPPVAPPTPPKVKSSILRFLPMILLGTILIGVIGFGIYWLFGRSNPEVQTPIGEESPIVDQRKVVTYWGLWEPSTVMAAVIQDFETLHPDVRIDYKQESHREYRERLQTKIAEGQGPDIFRFHASWVPMLRNELSPLPERIMSQSEFSQTFYPAAQQMLTVNNAIYGMPLMYEGLGLYYNTQIFSVANKTPPTNWEEMKDVAQELTIKSGSTITRSGLAMGTTNNVEHFADILTLLMLQNQVDLRNPTSQEAIDAMDFYTSFSKSLGVWDSTLPSSTVAFSRGDVAMMLAPSWRVHEIKAVNPNLEFAIAPVPQVPGAPEVVVASFWAEGVSAQSKNKEQAWEFVKYLSSAEVQKKFFSEARQLRAFGEIYARQDLAEELMDDKYVGAYLQDAPKAKGWYMNNYTHDVGVNDRIIKYYEDGINAVNSGQQTAKIMETIKQGIDQVLGQYSSQ